LLTQLPAAAAAAVAAVASHEIEPLSSGERFKAYNHRFPVPQRSSAGEWLYLSCIIISRCACLSKSSNILQPGRPFLT
jgi:hypothetical protein